jgi:hypothetical protein
MPPIALPGTVQQAAAGLSGFDINSTVSAAMAADFKNAGYDFCIRYVPRNDAACKPSDLSYAEAADILNAGLALMAVQHVAGGNWMPTAELGTAYGQYAASYAGSVVGLPPGMNIWLDLEGVGENTTADNVIAYSNAWYNEVLTAGYVPGVYIGWNVVINDEQAYHNLSFRHYWSAYNADVVPATRGYQLVQALQKELDGVYFDPDTTQTDHLGGTPLWLSTQGDEEALS